MIRKICEAAVKNSMETKILANSGGGYFTGGETSEGNFGDKKDEGKKTGGEKNVADNKAIFVKKIFVWI